jgi:nanoRNase/pAp phosphatase (c-di-AMP/oligoRNAs hydrolase)
MPDISELTPKQQTSEAIRQSETILITTGQHPSVDQAAAVLGLAAILRKFGKKVSAVISDGLPQAVQSLDTSGIDKGMAGMRDFVLKLDVSKAEVDKLRYEVQDGKLNIYITPFKGSFAPSDVTFDYGSAKYDLIIVLGVPTRARIDHVYEQGGGLFDNTPVANVDFHRSNENYGAINLIEPTASSLCEMLVALSESLQGGIIDDQIATTLLMGIVASTDRFTATHTTSKSLTVAAQMMAAGARQQSVVRALYRGGGGGDRGGAGGSDQRKPQQQGGQGRQNERPAEPRPERKPEPAPQSASAPQSAPAQENIIEPAHIEMSEPAKPEADEGPREVPPMADFAAAAEILARRRSQPDHVDEREDYEA